MRFAPSSQDARARTSFDAHIGERIRIAREANGLNQSELAGRLRNISYQALSKWEKGEVRLPSMRLWQIAYATGMPLSFFFRDMPADLAAEYRPRIKGQGKNAIRNRNARKSRTKATASRQTEPHKPPQPLHSEDIAFS